MAFLKDPADQILALWKSHKPGADTNELNQDTFVWEVSCSQNEDATWKFYSAVFEDWECYQRKEDKHKILSVKHGLVGSFIQGPPGSASQWLTHLVVDNVDKTVEKAKLLGGTVIVGPMDLPEMPKCPKGRMCLMKDNVGALVGFMQLKEPLNKSCASKCDSSCKGCAACSSCGASPTACVASCTNEKCKGECNTSAAKCVASCTNEKCKGECNTSTIKCVASCTNDKCKGECNTSAAASCTNEKKDECKSTPTACVASCSNDKCKGECSQTTVVCVASCTNDKCKGECNKKVNGKKSAEKAHDGDEEAAPEQASRKKQRK